MLKRLQNKTKQKKLPPIKFENIFVCFYGMWSHIIYIYNMYVYFAEKPMVYLLIYSITENENIQSSHIQVCKYKSYVLMEAE